MVTIKRVYFNRYCGILTKQRWLLKKEEELNDLLMDNNSDDEIALLLDLLESYSVTDQDTVQRFIEAMAENIGMAIESSAFSIISAMTRSRTPDSGQMIAELIKPALSKRKLSKYSLINTLDKLPKELKEHPETETILLLDEVVGSGQTLNNQLKFIRSNNTTASINIRICVLAAIKSSLESVVSHYSNVDYYCPLLLLKGISERYEGDTLSRNTAIMHNIENKLAKKVGKYSLSDFSFGYGGAELLYSHETWNAPNSMFPVFWWPEDKYGKDRKTLFTRSL